MGLAGEGVLVGGGLLFNLFCSMLDVWLPHGSGIGSLFAIWTHGSLTPQMGGFYSLLRV